MIPTKMIKTRKRLKGMEYSNSPMLFYVPDDTNKYIRPSSGEGARTEMTAKQKPNDKKQRKKQTQGEILEEITMKQLYGFQFDEGDLPDLKEVLQQQSNKNQTKLIKPKRLIQPLSHEEKDELFATEPVPRLHVVLPKAVASTDEFMDELERFRMQRKELDKIHMEETTKLLRKHRTRAKKLEKVKRKGRHQSILLEAGIKMRLRLLIKTFQAWATWSRKCVNAREFFSRLMENKIRECYIGWIEYTKESKLEKECSCVAIQCAWRRKIAYMTVEAIKQQHQAASKINACVRRYLVKRLIERAEAKHKKHEEIVGLSLKRIAGSAMTRTFKAWLEYTLLSRNIKRVAGKSNNRLLDNTFHAWQKTAHTLHRYRVKRAIALVQRVARGYLARKRVRRMIQRDNAAIMIQCNFRFYKAQRLVRRLAHQRSAILAKARRHVAGTTQHAFANWKIFAKQHKKLVRLMKRARNRRLIILFERWKIRPIAGLMIQRVYRGHAARVLANKLRLDNIVLNLNSESSIQQKINQVLEMLKLNEGQQVHSTELERLENELLFVINTEEKYFDLNIHGTEQRFEIEKHQDFLLTILKREFEKERKRIIEEQANDCEDKRKELQDWKDMMRFYIGDGKFVSDEDYEAPKSSGKTFKLKIENKADVKDTIKRWKEMFSIGLVTRSVLVSWVAEGLLLDKGITADKRPMVWKVIEKKFEREFVQDLAAFVLQQINDKTVF